MSTAVGCLAHLVLLAALTVGLEQAMGAGVADPLRPWASLIAAALLVLGASNLFHLARGYGRGDQSRAAILSRATTGEPPRDGGPMVVTGVARPASGQALISPLSRTPCVAYEYRLYERVWMAFGERRGLRVIWLGMATQPFMVDAGGRSIRVIAQPELVEQGRDRTRSEAMKANATAWVSNTRFAPFSEAGMGPVFSAMTSAYTRPHPAGLRLDWGRQDAMRDPAALRMDEGVVPAGEQVSVAGHWSPDLQAIVPAGGLAGARVTVAVGDASNLGGRATALPSSALAVALFGLLMLGMGAALAWAMQTGLLAEVPATFR